MHDIPEIVEELYFQMVTIPEKEDWPAYMRGSETAIKNLYAFYEGLRMGIRLSAVCRFPNS